MVCWKNFKNSVSTEYKIKVMREKKKIYSNVFIRLRVQRQTACI